MSEEIKGSEIMDRLIGRDLRNELREHFKKRWHDQFDNSWAGYSQTDEDCFVDWAEEFIREHFYAD